jgi:hypothetical protein
MVDIGREPWSIIAKNLGTKDLYSLAPVCKSAKSGVEDALDIRVDNYQKLSAIKSEIENLSLNYTNHATIVNLNENKNSIFFGIIKGEEKSELGVFIRLANDGKPPDVYYFSNIMGIDVVNIKNLGTIVQHIELDPFLFFLILNYFRERLEMRISAGEFTVLIIKDIEDIKILLDISIEKYKTCPANFLGGRPKKFTYKGRKYNVKYGKKGGQYIVVNNEKKYIKA